MPESRENFPDGIDPAWRGARISRILIGKEPWETRRSTVHTKSGLPEHHPEEALLLDYAFGNAAEAVALILAIHLVFCPRCRATVAAMESAASRLVEGLPSRPMREAALDRLLLRLDEPEAVAEPDAALGYPAPLAAYLGSGEQARPWRKLGRGIEQLVLPTAPSATRAMLLRVAAGRRMPKHTHRGNELTLVLQGDYSDQYGRYAQGDFEAADGSLTHSPAIGKDEPCVSLVVLDAPLRLAGALGRIINPFVQL